MSDSSTTQQAPAASPPESKRPKSGRYLLWRLWLVVAVPLSYPAFVLGSLIMLSMIPVSYLFHRSPASRTRWLRHVLHRGAGLWVKFSELCRLLVITVDDRRNLDERSAALAQQPNQPVLVIANHPSLIDVLLICATLPDLCCVLKGALHYNPLFTLLIRHLNYLPNSDPERMLEEGSQRLRAGERLLIFPEGTRSEHGQPLQFRYGAAELAVRSGAAALPVTLHSNSRYLSKGYPWYRFPPQKLRYRIEVGPLLPATGDPADNPASQPAGNNRADRRQARRALNALWQNHFHQRLNALGVGN